MVTGELKSKVDRIWDAFWTGGMSNPLEIIEQITYLLFIRRLDELQIVEEKKAARTGRPVEKVFFREDQRHLRWQQLRHEDAQTMHRLIAEEIFPLLQNLGNDESTYSDHMRNARFTINAEKAGILTRVVDLVDSIPMDRRDTNGDLYEYMLSKISTSGTNGQFRTPRHIIEMMVAMTNPKPGDRIIDPACHRARRRRSHRHLNGRVTRPAPARPCEVSPRRRTRCRRRGPGRPRAHRPQDPRRARARRRRRWLRPPHTGCSRSRSCPAPRRGGHRS